MPEQSSLRLYAPLADFATDAIESWEIESDFTQPSDAWSVTVGGDVAQLVGLLGHPVMLSLAYDGSEAIQVRGRIDRVDCDSGSPLVTFSGRDRIADLTTSMPSQTAKTIKGQTVKDLIKLACAPYGIDEVVDDDGLLTRAVRSVVQTDVRQTALGTFAAIMAGRESLRDVVPVGVGLALRVYKATTGTRERIVDRAAREVEEIKPAEQQSVGEYVMRVLARTGATLQPSVASRRQVVVAAPDYDQRPAGSLILDTVDAGRNNIISSAASRDVSQLPSLADFTGASGGKGKPASRLSQTYSIPALLRASGIGELSRLADVLDDERKEPGDLGDGLRLYRYRYHQDREAKTSDALRRLATHAVSESLRDTLSYSATVHGHRDAATGLIWHVGSVVNVLDDRCAVDEPMWVSGTTHRYSASGDAATTEIRCWRLGTYQVDA